MPDLTGLPALDVAIGLSFIFLLLSVAASAVQEFVANLFSLRAKVLERGLRNMLADPAAAHTDSHGAPNLLLGVYTHPMIRSLYRESWFPLGRKTLRPIGGAVRAAADAQGAAADRGAAADSPAGDGSRRADVAVPIKVRLPSYIAPRSFALALVDTMAPAVLATDPDTGVARPDHDVIRETRAAVLALDIPSEVKHRLLTLLDDARGDIDAFRRNIEAWFDDTMARVSGWYKRRTQLIILAIAVVLTVAINANTLTMGERLWRDPTTRATLVQQAGAADATPAGQTASDKLNNAVNNVESVAKAGVPIGWAHGANSNADPRHITLGSVSGWAHLVGGWLLTILAISLGAPFWFDTLSRLSRLRGTGKPETPLPASGRGQPGERIVATTPPVNVAVQHIPAIAAAASRPNGDDAGPAAHASR